MKVPGFLDADFVKLCRQDYELIRHRRKNAYIPPLSAEERALIDCEKAFEAFYLKVFTL